MAVVCLRSSMKVGLYILVLATLTATTSAKLSLAEIQFVHHGEFALKSK